MEKKLFHYVGPAKHAGTIFSIGDIIVVTKSTMPEMYIRAVHVLSNYAYQSKYIETMYNPLYLFRVKKLKINNNDHIPGF